MPSVAWPLKIPSKGIATKDVLVLSFVVKLEPEVDGGTIGAIMLVIA